MPVWHSDLNVKALVGVINQEKVLVGAFSVIIRTFVWLRLKPYSPAQPGCADLCIAPDCCLGPPPATATSHSHGRNTEPIKQQETQVANVPKAEFAIRILAMLWVVQNENCTVWRPSTPGQTLDSHGTSPGWRLRWLDMVSKNRCNYCPVSRVLWIAMVIYSIRESY